MSRLSRFLAIKVSRNHSVMTLFFIMIGILALALAISVLFLPFMDTKVKTSSTVPIKLNTPEFFTALEGIANSDTHPLQADESFKILSNGDEFFPDLYNEMSNAKHSITLANYIWSKGEVNDTLLPLLKQKAAEGIAVRMIIDGKGSVKYPQSDIDALRQAGVKVEIFRPIGLKTITRLFKASHVRAIVVDGQVAYIGGMAFNDEWLGDGTGAGHWRDMMFKVHGAPAQSIQNIFNTLWRQTSGEILTGSDFYPALESDSNASTSSKFITLFHSPASDLDKNLSQFLWLSLMGAERSIHIETPYMTPDENILSALETQAKNGVDVEIIMPGPYIDSKIVRAASRSYYSELMAAGVHIYEYQPGRLHAKVITIDGHWSVIGSANLDNRSNALNVEGIMGVEDGSLATGIEQQFEVDKSKAQEVDKESFAQNWIVQGLGRLSRLFAKQY